MAFIKDDCLQIKLDHHNNMIHISAYDRVTRQEVCLGLVQGRQHANSKGDWISDPPDMFVAEKIREMVHRLLSDVQALL